LGVSFCLNSAGTANTITKQINLINFCMQTPLPQQCPRATQAWCSWVLCRHYFLKSWIRAWSGHLKV